MWLGLRIFLNKPFQRFVRKEGITYDAICEAIKRADRGLIDADLGGGVIKQRIPRPNEGRSGGYRWIVIYRVGEVALFIHGFAKNEKDNITDLELSTFRELAKAIFEINPDKLDRKLEERNWTKVNYDE